MDSIKAIFAQNDREYSEAAVIKIVTMYFEGRDRAAKQREEGKLAKEFAKSKQDELKAYVAQRTFNGGGHSAGSGGATRK